MNLRYYDVLFLLALKYGAEAKSIIEVGCASDPLVQYFDWIEERVCVAPYFIKYHSSTKNSSAKTSDKIRKVTADFMEYHLPNNGTKFDLLLCNQVVEHIVDAAPFVKKLIDSAKIGKMNTVKKNLVTDSIIFRWKCSLDGANHICLTTREL